MKIVETFSPEANFWKEHSQLAAAGPIKKLYDEDTSKQKMVSSKLMWCIVLIWDRNSLFYNLPEIGEDSKIVTIFEDYYGSLEAYESNKALINEIKDFYLKLQETPAERSVRSVEKKLEERAKFLNETDYTLGTPTEKGTWVGGTAAILDGMLANTKKITDLYETALKAVATEAYKSDGIAKGGGRSSASDEEKI